MCLCMCVCVCVFGFVCVCLCVYMYVHVLCAFWVYVCVRGGMNISKKLWLWYFCVGGWIYVSVYMSFLCMFVGLFMCVMWVWMWMGFCVPELLVCKKCLRECKNVSCPILSHITLVIPTMSRKIRSKILSLLNNNHDIFTSKCLS